MEEEDDVADAIRSFVNHFIPSLREAETLDQAEEVLRNAEETDENFHRLEFVTMLNSKIEKDLSVLLDREVERQKLTEKPVDVQGQLQDRIVASILKSPAYGELRKSILTSTKDAAEYLATNYVDEEVETQKSSDRHGSKHWMSSRKTGGGTQYSFSEESSVGSSYNHSGYGFLGRDYFHQVISGMDAKNSLEVRKKAMQDLLRINPADILEEVQAPLKSALFDSLSDPDNSISEKALKYIMRLLSNSGVSLTKSIFLAFMEHISVQFNARKTRLPAIRDGLSVDNYHHSIMLVKIRLMRDFMLQVSKYWIRYPSERLMEEIVKATVEMLSSKANSPPGSPEILSPVHFLALIDPKAVWFKTWIHGAFSRNQLMQLFAKHRSMVEGAVKSCHDFYAKRVAVKDPVEEASKQKLTPRTSVEVTYKARHLEFAYFIHSVHVLSHVLRFKKGRELFPIKQKGGDDITIEKLLVNLLQFVVQPISHKDSVPLEKAEFNPSELVKAMFRRLAAEEIPLAICLCNNHIASILLEPVMSWMEYSNGNSTSPTLPSQSTMLDVADILSVFCSSDRGKRFLLQVNLDCSVVYPSAGKSSAGKSTMKPCQILCDFTIRALRGDFNCGGLDVKVNRVVIESFLYVCRQMYSNHEEFREMNCSELSSAASQAWQDSLRDVDLAVTPTPDNDSSTARGGGESSRPGGLSESQSNEEFKWQQILVDNMLNFSANPRGLLLLLQTGALKECSQHMFSRYSKKLQVSKCEKFGYGVLVSKISACAAGMNALLECGFLSLFVSECWANLECSPDDRKVTQPYSYPVESIDGFCMKSFNSLLNVIGSFPAVFETFHGVKLSTKQNFSFREPPGSLPDFINRLVFVENKDKLHSLFNEDQSHTFGLRIMNAICCCLDSMLLIQSQYGLTKTLLDCQKANKLEKGSGYILDMPTVERNHLLVRTNLLGGYSERSLPKRNCSIDVSDYSHPVFHQLPVPAAYSPTNNKAYNKVATCDLSKFMTSTKTWQHDDKWLQKCAANLVTSLSAKANIKGSLVPDVLEKVLDARCAVIPEWFCNDSSDVKDSEVNSEELPPMQKQAAHLLLQYGQYLKLLAGGKEEENHLLQTLKRSRVMLRSQMVVVPKGDSSTESKFVNQSSGYPGADWFVGVMYLMFMGDQKRCWTFLKLFAKSMDSCVLWPARSFLYKGLPKTVTGTGMEPLMYCVGNNIDRIVELELPHVASAFRMSGYSAALISQHWLRQCFLNFFNWNDIVHFMLLCVISGVDYQVYTCVAVLNHLSRKILHQSNQQTLVIFLKEEPFTGFKLSDYLDYIRDLHTKYSHSIIADIRSSFGGTSTSFYSKQSAHKR